MRILITGGCGFIGHHILSYFLQKTDSEFIVLDQLNYASNGYDRLRYIGAYNNPRVTILSADFSYPLSKGVEREIGNIDYIFHVGAESHVENSIKDPITFIRSNVEGTAHILNLARKLQLKCFFYFSTDEVYGPAPEGVAYTESDPHNPQNPYAATKSAGEMLVRAYRNTYKTPAIITRSMNVFGERQHPEKFIPKIIKQILAGETVAIHSYPNSSYPGSRFYIHTTDIADAHLFLISKIESRQNIINEDFNISGEYESNNLEMANRIADILGQKLKYKIVSSPKERPGYDVRYAIDGSKFKKLGWSSSDKFNVYLEDTVKWTASHPEWLIK